MSFPCSFDLLQLISQMKRLIRKSDRLPDTDRAMIFPAKKKRLIDSDDELSDTDIPVKKKGKIAVERSNNAPLSISLKMDDLMKKYGLSYMMYIDYHGIQLPFTYILTHRRKTLIYRSFKTVLKINTEFPYGKVLENPRIKFVYDLSRRNDPEKSFEIKSSDFSMSISNKCGKMSLLININELLQENVVLKKSNFSQDIHQDKFRLVEVSFVYESVKHLIPIGLYFIGENRFRLMVKDAETNSDKFINDVKKLCLAQKIFSTGDQGHSDDHADIDSNDTDESIETLNDEQNDEQNDGQNDEQNDGHNIKLIKSCTHGVEYQYIIPSGFVSSIDSPPGQTVKDLISDIKNRIEPFIPQIAEYYFSEYLDILQRSFDCVSENLMGKISTDYLNRLYLLFTSHFFGGIVAFDHDKFIQYFESNKPDGKTAFFSCMWDYSSRQLTTYLFMYHQGLTVIELSPIDICSLYVPKVLTNESIEGKKCMQKIWDMKSISIFEITNILNYMKYCPFTIAS